MNLLVLVGEIATSKKTFVKSMVKKLFKRYKEAKIKIL